jgi:hypothetical protein
MQHVVTSKEGRTVSGQVLERAGSFRVSFE